MITCLLCQGRHVLRGRDGRFVQHSERLDYDAYLESEYQAAEAATRGHMLSPAGLARGLRPSGWFLPRPRVSEAHASDELRAHFRVRGRPLAWSEYSHAVCDRAA